MKYILLIIVTLFLVSCTSHNSVVPDLDGIKKVPVNSEILDNPFLSKAKTSKRNK